MMERSLKFLIITLIAPLLFASYQATHSMDALKGDSFTKYLPYYIRARILEIAAFDLGARHANLSTLALVSKDWRKIVNEDKLKNNNKIKLSWLQGAYDITSPKEKEIFERFYSNGQLTYTRKIRNNEEIITLAVSNLINPLNGKFNISSWEEADKHLSIRTGYPKGEEQNVDKAEIWFVLRFLIEKDLKTTASHFKDIYDKWNPNVPMGVFWRGRGSNDFSSFDYLITENMDKLSEKNLYRHQAFTSILNKIRLKPTVSFIEAFVFSL